MDPWNKPTNSCTIILQEKVINCHVSHLHPTYDPSLYSGSIREISGSKRGKRTISFRNSCGSKEEIPGGKGKKEDSHLGRRVGVPIHFLFTYLLLGDCPAFHSISYCGLFICIQNLDKKEQNLTAVMTNKFTQLTKVYHSAPLMSVSAFISYRHRGSNPCLPHAILSRYRLSHAASPSHGCIFAV